MGDSSFLHSRFTIGSDQCPTRLKFQGRYVLSDSCRLCVCLTYAAVARCGMLRSGVSRRFIPLPVQGALQFIYPLRGCIFVVYLLRVPFPTPVGALKISICCLLDQIYLAPVSACACSYHAPSSGFVYVLFLRFRNGMFAD